MMLRTRLVLILAVIALVAAAVSGRAQSANQRLILKDGSYQVVTRYQVVGERVRYISAERGGDWEEVPTDLVDWMATDKWNKAHKPGADQASDAQPQAPASENAADIDKQEQQERADELARQPFVAPNLRLPDESGVWVMDTYKNTPELVRLEQSNGDVNRDTGHNVLRSAINPLGGAKEPIQIDGARSKVQLHVNLPEIYVSLDGGSNAAPDNAMPVDTHGASSKQEKNAYSSPASRYAIVRVQPRKGVRVIGAVKISMLGKVSNSEDVVETSDQVLPGKHWMKVTPRQPLSFGEYALMELLAPGEVNMDVWDFGVDPTAPENKNSVMPIKSSRPDPGQ
ncbi:MAG: hypothetical protein HIU93_08650 [Acidobacteria bacterium]|nr:hypothetical protein [Acidobacteriota bacterium]MBW4045636.1 hypothetical protein [Acidobacteriota bacterium]